MPQLVTAIYENGVLKPLTPLNLKEEQVVSVSVEPIVSTSPVANEDYVSPLEEQGEVDISWSQVQAVLAKLPGPLSMDFECERDERI